MTRVRSTYARATGTWRGRAGFTLVESLIVLAILSAITGVVLVFVVGMSCRVNTREAQIEVRNLTGLIESYRHEASRGELPESLEDLTRGEAPLTKMVPRDPWGGEYAYRKLSDTDFEVVCAGPDGVHGTEDDIGAREEPRVR